MEKKKLIARFLVHADCYVYTRRDQKNIKARGHVTARDHRSTTAHAPEVSRTEYKY